MKTKLKSIIYDTVENCFKKGALTKAPIPDFVIEIPNNTDHGHFATNISMTLASSQKRPPRDIASIILDNLIDNEQVIERADIAGPGFINFIIAREHWYDILAGIIELNKDFGKSRKGTGQKVLVEFVSANPTGPLHLGHGRGAALGDTLCRVLSSQGYNIVREFYINDAGQQIRLLGESIYSRIRQITEPDYPFPENGYQGHYVIDLAKEISGQINVLELAENEAVNLCAEKGKAMMLEEIKHDLAQFRVAFDVWFSENGLHNSGSVEKTLQSLRKSGQLYEEDGALWIKTSDFGDDKDRVIQKNDGQLTYFASDISYHLKKHERGFDRAINLWGADHHGYIPRMKAALSSNGIQGDWLSVMLIQLVKLWQGGREIKMSKRTGDFVTLQELVDEVGVDAVRFVFLTKNHDSPLDFDIDLVKKQDSENPVYYVQYAHARICSLFRKAEAEDIALPPEPQGILDHLVLEEELALIRLMAGFPSLLEDISENLEPHRLTYYLTDLAASFHRYFNLGNKIAENRVITSDLSLSHARLFLVKAVKIVIANGLGLLGIQAPEKM